MRLTLDGAVVNGVGLIPKVDCRRAHSVVVCVTGHQDCVID
jgi:hypothetical protein